MNFTFRVKNKGGTTYLRQLIFYQPFKLGLVQGGEWDTGWQRRLAHLPNYGGEVVFLLNPPSA